MARQPEWLEKVPSELRVVLSRVRERVERITEQYGDMRRYGRPPFETVEEVAVIYYIIKKVASYRELAKWLGVQHVTVYRWKKAIEKGRINIAGKMVEVNADELLKMAEELAKPKARKWLKSVTDSAVIQEFISNPVKRQKTSKHGLYYTESQVKRTIHFVNELAKFIQQNKELIERRTKREATNNPDLWDEDYLRVVIDLYCAHRYVDSFKQLRCKREIKLHLRRIPKWRDWFSGEIGTVRSVIRPKESTLFLEHYYRLKRMALESDDPEFKAFFLVAALHIWSGAREGWGSLKNRLERMRMEGVKLRIRGLKDLDLDDEMVNTSLIGIRWSRAKWSADGSLVGFEIFEEKTQKWWQLSIVWLDEDIPKLLREVYEETARPQQIDSVVKSILVHYGVFKRKRISVHEFRNWYSRWVRRLKELLGLPWDMTPHRLRSAHIAIMAELRIPMEMALSNLGFGVGWEDATTAVIFYLRFSQTLLRDYLQQAEEIKKRILAELGA